MVKIDLPDTVSSFEEIDENRIKDDQEKVGSSLGRQDKLGDNLE